MSECFGDAANEPPLVLSSNLQYSNYASNKRLKEYPWLVK